MCSVISSNLKISQGHLDRLQFIDILLNHFGDKIDVFGRGFNDIVDKWDAIVPYKYHIVIENSSFEDYWTEKLADAFLGESYPIYYGAKNINSYFDKESLATIDINKPEEAVKIIEEAINGNYYEKYKNQIIKSKNKVLDEYNLFPTIISKVIDKNTKIYEKSKINIKPEIYFQINLLKKIKLILRKKRIINRIWSKYRKLRPKNI
ncbi:MAG TPA: glycosyltransferase family 10 [Methanofastidiosum sp.]|nr:glycosyltransferase family 10 [Methanofastidiosum sp.]